MKILNKILKKSPNRVILNQYYKRFCDNAFQIGHCSKQEQYEASITRLYHTIEKGLTYENYRAGFGKDNISNLITEMENYSKIYDIDTEFYQTALSVLHQYQRKNKEYGVIDEKINSRISALKGKENNKGGIITFTPWSEKRLKEEPYGEVVKNRHSIRHFSTQSVKLEDIYAALDLAQATPSACNRQGWKVNIIAEKTLVGKVLQNQNGNRGFGQEIDKLLLITADLRYFNSDREVFQPYIDGGMYAMSVINSLHYEHIATIPLSASLSKIQEDNIRTLLNLNEAEVFILFVGVGNYPEHCQTTLSERHEPRYRVLK